MEIVTKKIVVEFKYFPVFKFMDYAHDILQPIISQYDTVEDSPHAIRLLNNKRFTLIVAERQRTGISVENVTDDALFDLELKNLFALVERCKVSMTLRLGVRTWFLAPYDNISYTDAIKQYTSNQLRLENLALKPPDLRDAAIVLEGMDEGYDIRLQSGVMDDAQIKRDISEFKNFTGDPKVALVHDTDRYINAEKPLPKFGEIRKMINHNRTILENYLKDHHVR
jgi:hypothetical protein